MNRLTLLSLCSQGLQCESDLNICMYMNVSIGHVKCNSEGSRKLSRSSQCIYLIEDSPWDLERAADVRIAFYPQEWGYKECRDKKINTSSKNCKCLIQLENQISCDCKMIGMFSYPYRPYMPGIWVLF